jgi:hypothetical protein
MTLSEAIRLGAMLKPQVIGSVGNHGSCALRAAADAVGIEDGSFGQLDYFALAQRWPVLNVMRPACPACSRTATLMCQVYHLNDIHLWKREAIADWVETVERSLEDATHHEADKRVVSESEVLTPS